MILLSQRLQAHTYARDDEIARFVVVVCEDDVHATSTLRETVNCGYKVNETQNVFGLIPLIFNLEGYRSRRERALINIVGSR
ncbi:hypothetical protein L596_000544 [Steinernema carpocapsae]|uniref:Uncharacterized protein n=1 Tax=Steinernema carpocapsae TaxID=34508 RepID=A0A4U8UJT6_STECR|nr:hypothetical protein L596_000544 [Steinernema carpocapsae]